MILRNSFTQSCLSFARPMWTRYRKDFLWMIWGTLAAILVSTVVPNIPAGAFGTPLFLFRALKLTSSGIGLLLFVGCYSLASKIGTNFSAETDSRRLMVLTYTLPLSTRDLVLAPMVAAVLSVSTFWIVFWLLAVFPYGGPVPLVLPILLTSLMIAAAQASSWTLYVRGGIGCLFLMISICAPMLAIVGMLNHFPMVVMNAVTASLIVMSVSLALKYAPISRHSVTNSLSAAALEKRAKKNAKQSKQRALPTLSSPLSAQIWFHQVYRLSAITRIFVGVAAAYLLIRIQTSTSELAGVGKVRMVPDVYQFWFILPIAGFIAVLFMTVIGMTVNGMPTKEQKSLPPMPTFSAIRPITTAELFVSQAVTAFRSALAATYVVWISGILWTFSPIEVNGKTIWVLNYLLSHLTVKACLLILLLAAFVPVVVFNFQMASMARSRLPKRLGQFIGYAPAALIFGFVEVMMLTKTPDLGTLGDWGPTLWFIGMVLLTIKVALIPVAQIKLEQNRLLSRETFFKCAGTWLAIVIALTGAFYALLPSRILSLPQLFVLVAIIIPANRMLWQIYCLDITRHVGATK